LLVLVLPGWIGEPVHGASVVVGAAMDFFNYGNAPSGTSTSVPVFAVLNTADPDRLGTMVVGFDTSGSVAAGLEPSQYAVTAVRLVLNLQNSLLYDPTLDPVGSYIAGGTDADLGRPFEVYGLGLRNGYTGLGFDPENTGPPLFSETSGFEPAGSSGAYVLHAYPISLGAGVLRGDGDVTDSVSEGWEVEPFAIGVVDGVQPGAATPLNSRVVFSMNLTDPAILNYFQEGLATGAIGLNVASLHASDGIGQGSYPRFSSREHASPERRPTLEIEYTVIPEPSNLMLLALAGAVASGRRRRRNQPPG
jgi:hypothetical protein